MVRLSCLSAMVLIIFTGPVWAVQTSHWTHTNESDFKKGTFHHVVATNFGDLKLSRAVKTLLEQDAKVSAVYALAEGQDGSIYAATGPNGVLLRIKDDKINTVATFEDNTNLFAILIDSKGRLLIGISGEKGRVVRIDEPAQEDSKPVDVFTEEGVQYIWGLQQTPDGNVYIATGPTGKLFELTPDGKSSTVLASDETNLLSLLSDGKDLLYVGTDPNGLVYRVNRKTREVFVLFDAPESEISCLALDKDGNLYAGTAEAAERPATGAPGGPNGAAIGSEKSGRPEGTGGIPIPAPPARSPKPPNLPEPNPGEPDPIPKGKINRVVPAGKKVQHTGFSQSVFVARALLPGSQGWGAASHKLLSTQDIQTGRQHVDFAFFADENPGASQPAPEKKPPAIPTTLPAPNPLGPPLEPDQAAQPKVEGNAVYRIDKEGFVTEIFRQPALVLSIIEQNGNLLVGTGSEGLIYQIDPKAEETLVLARVEPKQVLCLLAAKDGRILLGMANVGGIAAMSGGYATEGTFTSPVLDATQISRFGKIHLHGSLPGGSTLTIATRSGNVQDPDKTGWSKWSEDTAATTFLPVTSPFARFLQYRVTFTSLQGKTSPVVDDIDVAYQIPNIAPVIKSLKVGPNNLTPPIALLPAPKPSAVEAPSPDSNRLQTISWESEDANNDTLTFSIYFRSGAKSPWILLKDKLAENHFDWDTKLVADGRYEIKVIASDAASNPPGEGKTASRVSEPFLVDNTPPVIGDLKSTVKGRAVTIKATVVDRTSIVAGFAYSVDSNSDWQAVLPSDSIFDSPEEAVSFVVKGLSPGVHQIMLRATDAKGNQAHESLTVTVEAPAAKR